MTKPTKKITYSQSWDLSHAPEKVWRALTESDLLAQWIMSNDMRAVVGHRFTFRTEPTQWWDGIVYCEVLKIESHKLIQYSWQGGKNRSGGYGVDTIVTWTLSPTKSGGTLLSIEQAGFDPESTQAFQGAKMGWERNIKALGRIL